MKALLVGITGGIGAGKSLACSTLAKLGAQVVDADEIAREQAKPGGSAHRLIAKAFGTSDRSEIAKVVFRDAKARRRLEKITHPFVVKEMSRRLRSAKSSVAIAAAPLLFEAGLDKMFDVTVTIEAAEQKRRRRAGRRDAASMAHISARMKAQLSDRARARRSDVVIRNEGAKREFISMVRSYYRAFELLQRGACAAAAAEE
jgi:dephospho-CoA kinase